MNNKFIICAILAKRNRNYVSMINFNSLLSNITKLSLISIKDYCILILMISSRNEKNNWPEIIKEELSCINEQALFADGFDDALLALIWLILLLCTILLNA